MTKKVSKYNILAVILLAALFSITILPLTGYAEIAPFTTDGRWWHNAYYEHFMSFPNLSNIAINGFNHSGLAINMFYPIIPIRIIQLPLLWMNVKSPYIMMVYMNIIAAVFMLIPLYLLSRELKIKQPFLIATILLLVQLTPIAGSSNNSLPQLFSNMFMLWGIYGIISKRYPLIIVTTVLILTTSFATSIVAAITYTLVLLLQHAPIDEWLQTITHGLIGIVLSLPIIGPILKHLGDVNKPTDLFESFDAPWTIYQRIITGQTSQYDAYLIRTIVIIFIAITLTITFTKISKKSIPWLMMLLLIANTSPKIGGVLASPIQPGTFGRMWILVTIITLYAMVDFNTPKQYGALLIIAIPVLALILYSLKPSTNIHDYKENTTFKAIKNKDWDQTYNNLESDLKLIPKSKHASSLISIPKNTAKFSMDYTPAKATVEDNYLVFMSNSDYKKKYGVTKESTANGTTIKIKVDPKSNSTPLAVWHYNFINYDIKTTSGKVVANSHDLFEYHGTKKATILISEKQ